MSDNLPPLIPPGTCESNPVAVSTPVLLRSALEGPPVSFPATGAGTLLDPAGSDNEIIVVANANGAAGNNITVAISNPAAGALVTSALVDGPNITIVPGARARMIVTGAGTAIFNGTYRHAGNFPGTTRQHWQKINTGTDVIRIAFPVADNIPNGEWVFSINGDFKYSSATVTYDILTQPENLVFHTVSDGALPPPETSAMVSDAQQAINALSLSPEVSALVTSAPLNLATGSVATLLATALEGGVDGQEGTTPAAIGQFCRVGPYVVLPPRTQEYDWFIAETMNSWRQVFE